MGAVFLAEDTRLHRKVALKVLPQEMASNPDRLARFEREAQAVAALNHPHIVTIHSVEEAEGTRFLTMELVEGTSLEQALTRGGLPLAKVFDIGIALADALAAAHARGIVHRDLKPANVMLAADGRIKVLDFGLAKLTPEDPAAPQGANLSGLATAAAGGTPGRALTDAGMVLGTAPYMSPEQVNGLDVDARTDIFSLGVVLYELATGRRPFGGNTRAETISSILRDTPRPVSEARQDAPRHLGRIIDHCLQKDPEARFQSAKDVRNELRSLRKEMESDAPGGSAPGGIAHAAGMSGPASAPVPASHPGTAPPTGPAPGSGPTPMSGPVSAPGSAPGSGAMPGTAASRPWLWAGAGALLVLMFGAVFWLGGRQAGAPGAAPSTTGGNAPSTAILASAAATNSVAVLPFSNLSADKDQEYFSDGLTEELLNALARIPDLKVTGKTSSFSFKGKNEDLRSIGEKLGVAHLLEGSVRRSGNRVRVTAKLVKAADGFHLWSETYDRTLDDIFAVQDDIATTVARELQVTLLGPGAGGKRPNAEAYDLLLQARHLIQVSSEENIRRAETLVERALALSPDYAPAWADAGLVHIRKREVATSLQEGLRATQAARAAFTKALELDPDQAVALSRLAGVQMAAWEFAEAEKSAARSLAAAPKNAMVLGNAALVYSFLGRVDQAIRLAEEATRLDPLSPVNHVNLANYYLYEGRLDDADKAIMQTLALRADNPMAQQTVGLVALKRGRIDEARTAFEKSAALVGSGDHARLGAAAIIEHTAGNAAASTSAVQEFEKRFGEEDPASCAYLRAWRGENDQAFAWLDKAYRGRDPSLAAIKTESLFLSLHSDPRWNVLLGKIGLPTD